MSGMQVLPDTVLKFLSVEPAAVLAMPIDESGSIHAAPLVFWIDPDNYELFFVTGRDSEKCKLLRKQTEVQAACVIGTVKGTPYCLQMRGHATIAGQKAYSQQIEAYYKKRGNRNDNIDDPETVLLQFRPQWIRVTDYSGGDPQRAIWERT